jgi:hypothetical protein
MVLGCYYLTMDRPTPKGGGLRAFADEDEALHAYEVAARGLDGGSHRVNEAGAAVTTLAGPRLTLHQPIDVMVKAWDEEAGELRDRRVRTTAGRIIFNQIVPDRLRFSELPTGSCAAPSSRSWSTSAIACSALRRPPTSWTGSRTSASSSPPAAG